MVTSVHGDRVEPHVAPCNHVINHGTMRAIAKWEEVPIFDSEEAEASFWAENKPDLRLMEAAVASATEVSRVGDHLAAD